VGELLCEAAGFQSKIFITKNKVMKILYHRDIVTKIALYWYGNGQIDQWDKIEDSEISSNCHSLLNF
jgi:hypothetical protein